MCVTLNGHNDSQHSSLTFLWCLGGTLFLSSGSGGLKLSPLLQGSCVKATNVKNAQQETKTSTISTTELNLFEPEPILLPAGEFYITEAGWQEENANMSHAHPEVAVHFKVVRRTNYNPAVAVVDVDSGSVFCWLQPTQSNLLIPLLEESSACCLAGKWVRASSAQGVRLALQVRAAIDQSKIQNGRVIPKNEAEAAAWAALASLTRTNLFTSAPLSTSTGALSSSSISLNNSNASKSESKDDSSTLDSVSQMQKLLDSTSSSSEFEMVEPSSNLTCNLHPYQAQSLSWMVSREVSNASSQAVVAASKRLKSLTVSDVPDGWEKRIDPSSNKPFYVNLATGTAYQQLPQSRDSQDRDANASLEQDVEAEATSGGILADDMGLGKTIQMIALITTSGRPASGPIGTLIVCPLSVLGQWEAELTRRVKPGVLKVTVFHGPNRAADISELEDSDIVLTTYSTLSLEGETANSKTASKKRSRPSQLLLNHEWLRVVLDEAHMIKDRSTKTAKVCYQIIAKARWALTGTPVHNKLEDLFSLLHFIRVEPFSKWSWFKQFVMKNDERGYQRLQNVLGKVLLRRTKQETNAEGERLVQLPQRNVVVEELEFSPAEHEFYQSLFAKTRVKMNEILRESHRGIEGYANVLVMLLRLRQACCHPMLVKAANTDLSEDAALQCMRCEQEDATMSTPCNHSFCRSCLEGALQSTRSPQCPICPSLVSALQCGPMRSGSSQPVSPSMSPVVPAGITSVKIRALIRHLLAIRSEESDGRGPIKSVVFSQWTSMLSLIEIALHAEDICFVRLDGSLTQAARVAAIEAFNSDDRITVFLVSTKAGGQGLNLARASRCFIMDPWWCPATEDQAIDRVHRLGQTRHVVCVRFFVKGTVEMNILALQQSKFAMANKALDRSDLASIFNLAL